MQFCIVDCLAVEGNQERADIGDADVSGQLWHLQERRQLSGGLSEANTESRQHRLWLLKTAKEKLTF